MATLDLSLVTLSLTSLLHKNVRRLMGNVPPNALDVTTMPPEDIASPTTPTLNLHLYHVNEDAHYKNAIGRPGADPKIAGQPMALKLYYILTSHFELNQSFDAETQQRLMGMALKTFHDNPVIDDDLTIQPTVGEGPLLVMNPDLVGDGNHLEIILRPVEPEETLNFWAAEDMKTPRLSAFYEIRAVFMEPELSQRSSGTVFDIGLFVKSSAIARILSSECAIPFTPPAATGLGPQNVVVAPARTTLQAAAILDKPVIRILGHNLTAGSAQTLRLRSTHWTGDLPIDPALNPLWASFILPEAAGFVPQPDLILDDGAGGTINQALSPGIYEVGLNIRESRTQGLSRLDTDYDAGRTAISIGVHITSHSGPDGNGRLRLDVTHSVTLTDPDTTIALAVSGQFYQSVNAFPAAPDDVGTFRILANHLLIAPHFDPGVPGAHPVQLVINGAESQPFWMEF